MRRTGLYKGAEKKKELNPWWRGIGCVTTVVIFGISFWFSSWLIRGIIGQPHLVPNGFQLVSTDEPFPMPAQLRFVPGAVRGMQNQFRRALPWFGIGELAVPLFLASVVSVLSYGILSFGYAAVKGNPNDPREARDYQHQTRRNRKVRRCR